METERNVSVSCSFFGKRLKSLTAFVTVTAFVATTVWTPGVAVAASVQTEVPLQYQLNLDANLRFAIPQELGKIEQFKTGPGPAVFHIQTAHGHYEAQQKIRGILNFLEKNYGVTTVLVEGSASNLKPEILNFFPENKGLTMKANDVLAKAALVKGPELFLLDKLTDGGSRGTAVQALGVEDAAAYFSNRASFVDVLREKEKARKFLADMDLQIERLSSHYLNSDLRAFLKRLENFEKNQIPFDTWLSYIKGEALKRLGTDLASPAWQLEWPMLVRVFKIQDLSAKLDRSRFPKERDEFLKALKRFLPDGANSASQAASRQPSSYAEIESLLRSEQSSMHLPDPETTRLFEDMVSRLPRDFYYGKFPNVRAFIGILLLQSELSARGGKDLIDEVRRLVDTISDKLAGTPQEKELTALLKDHRLLSKLFALELAPEDYAQIIGGRKTGSGCRLKPSNLVKCFSSILYPSSSIQRVKSVKFSHVAELDRLFDLALKFYSGVKERDGIMEKKVEERIRQTGATKVAVITGGFHSAPFADHFTGENFTYALITPKLSGADDKGHEAYINNMLRLPDNLKQITDDDKPGLTPSAVSHPSSSTIENLFASDPAALSRQMAALIAKALDDSRAITPAELAEAMAHVKEIVTPPKRQDRVLVRAGERPVMTGVVSGGALIGARGTELVRSEVRTPGGDKGDPDASRSKLAATQRSIMEAIEAGDARQVYKIAHDFMPYKYRNTLWSKAFDRIREVNDPAFNQRLLSAIGPGELWRQPPKIPGRLSRELGVASLTRYSEREYVSSALWSLTYEDPEALLDSDDDQFFPQMDSLSRSQAFGAQVAGFIRRHAGENGIVAKDLCETFISNYLNVARILSRNALETSMPFAVIQALGEVSPAVVRSFFERFLASPPIPSRAKPTAAQSYVSEALKKLGGRSEVRAGDEQPQKSGREKTIEALAAAIIDPAAHPGISPIDLEEALINSGDARQFESAGLFQSPRTYEEGVYDVRRSLLIDEDASKEIAVSAFYVYPGANDWPSDGTFGSSITLFRKHPGHAPEGLIALANYRDYRGWARVRNSGTFQFRFPGQQDAVSVQVDESESANAWLGADYDGKLGGDYEKWFAGLAPQGRDRAVWVVSPAAYRAILKKLGEIKLLPLAALEKAVKDREAVLDLKAAYEGLEGEYSLALITSDHPFAGAILAKMRENREKNRISLKNPDLPSHLRTERITLLLELLRAQLHGPESILEAMRPVEVAVHNGRWDEARVHLGMFIQYSLKDMPSARAIAQYILNALPPFTGSFSAPISGHLFYHVNGGWKISFLPEEVTLTYYHAAIIGGSTPSPVRLRWPGQAIETIGSLEGEASPVLVVKPDFADVLGKFFTQTPGVPGLEIYSYKEQRYVAQDPKRSYFTWRHENQDKILGDYGLKVISASDLRAGNVVPLVPAAPEWQLPKPVTPDALQDPRATARVVPKFERVTVQVKEIEQAVSQMTGGGFLASVARVFARQQSEKRADTLYRMDFFKLQEAERILAEGIDTSKVSVYYPAFFDVHRAFRSFHHQDLRAYDEKIPRDATVDLPRDPANGAIFLIAIDQTSNLWFEHASFPSDVVLMMNHDTIPASAILGLYRFDPVSRKFEAVNRSESRAGLEVLTTVRLQERWMGEGSGLSGWIIRSPRDSVAVQMLLDFLRARLILDGKRTDQLEKIFSSNEGILLIFDAVSRELVGVSRKDNDGVYFNQRKPELFSPSTWFMKKAPSVFLPKNYWEILTRFGSRDAISEKDSSSGVVDMPLLKQGRVRSEARVETLDVKSEALLANFIRDHVVPRAPDGFVLYITGPGRIMRKKVVWTKARSFNYEQGFSYEKAAPELTNYSLLPGAHVRVVPAGTLRARSEVRAERFKEGDYLSSATGKIRRVVSIPEKGDVVMEMLDVDGKVGPESKFSAEQVDLQIGAGNYKVETPRVLKWLNALQTHVPSDLFEGAFTLQVGETSADFLIAKNGATRSLKLDGYVSGELRAVLRMAVHEFNRLDEAPVAVAVEVPDWQSFVREQARQKGLWIDIQPGSGPREFMVYTPRSTEIGAFFAGIREALTNDYGVQRISGQAPTVYARDGKQTEFVFRTTVTLRSEVRGDEFTVRDEHGFERTVRVGSDGELHGEYGAVTPQRDRSGNIYSGSWSSIPENDVRLRNASHETKIGRRSESRDENFDSIQITVKTFLTRKQGFRYDRGTKFYRRDIEPAESEKPAKNSAVLFFQPRNGYMGLSFLATLQPTGNEYPEDILNGEIFLGSKNSSLQFNSYHFEKSDRKSRIVDQYTVPLRGTRVKAVNDKGNSLELVLPHDVWRDKKTQTLIPYFEQYFRIKFVSDQPSDESKQSVEEVPESRSEVRQGNAAAEAEIAKAIPALRLGALFLLRELETLHPVVKTDEANRKSIEIRINDPDAGKGSRPFIFRLWQDDINPRYPDLRASIFWGDARLTGVYSVSLDPNRFIGVAEEALKWAREQSPEFDSWLHRFPSPYSQSSERTVIAVKDPQSPAEVTVTYPRQVVAGGFAKIVVKRPAAPTSATRTLHMMINGWKDTPLREMVRGSYRENKDGSVDIEFPDINGIPGDTIYLPVPRQGVSQIDFLPQMASQWLRNEGGKDFGITVVPPRRSEAREGETVAGSELLIKLEAPRGTVFARSETRSSSDQTLTGVVRMMAKRDQLPGKPLPIIVFESADPRVPEEAAKLFKDTNAPWILVSGRYGKHIQDAFGKNEGVNPETGETVIPGAIRYKEALVKLGVPADQIIVEDRSRDMKGNARETRFLLQRKGLFPAEAIFMHSPFLQLRGAQELRKALGDAAQIYECAAYFPEIPSDPAGRTEFVQQLLKQVQKLNDDVPEIPELNAINGFALRIHIEQKWNEVRSAHNQTKAGTPYVIPDPGKPLSSGPGILQKRIFPGGAKPADAKKPAGLLDPNPSSEVQRPSFLSTESSQRIKGKLVFNERDWRMFVAGDGELEYGSLLVPDRDVPLVLTDEDANLDLLTFHAMTQYRGYVNSLGIGGLTILHDHVFPEIPEAFENLSVEWDAEAGTVKTGRLADYPVDSKVLESGDLGELARAMAATAGDYMKEKTPFVAYFSPGRVVFIPLKNTDAKWNVEEDDLGHRWLTSLFLFGIVPYPEEIQAKIDHAKWTEIMTRIGLPTLSQRRVEEIERKVLEIAGKGNSKDIEEAIRFYTLHYLNIAEVPEIHERVSRKLLELYVSREKAAGRKARLRLVAKLGGTEIAWALATPYGLITPLITGSTHVGADGKPYLGVTDKNLIPEQGNSLADIIGRIVAPMIKLLKEYGVDPSVAELDAYISAPGFFDQNRTLTQDEPNIKNMPKGYRFGATKEELVRATAENRHLIENSIPNRLRMLAAGQGMDLDLNLIVEHDGTGHALGELGEFGALKDAPFILFNNIGTGYGNRGMLDREPVTGGAAVGFVRNEMPHFILRDPANGEWANVMGIFKGDKAAIRYETLPGSQTPNPYREWVSLEDYIKGGAVQALFKEAYLEALGNVSSDLHQAALAIQKDFNPSGDGNFDRRALGKIASAANPLMGKVYGERAYALGRGSAVIITDLLTEVKRMLDAGERTGKPLGLLDLRMVWDGFYMKFGKLGTPEKIKEGIVDGLMELGFSKPDAERFVRENIVTSTIPDDLRELLGGLPKERSAANKIKLSVVADQEAMSRKALEMVLADYRKAIASEKGYFVLGLATGSTQVPLYKLLVKAAEEKLIDFNKIHTFNMDEYEGLSPEVVGDMTPEAPGDPDISYKAFMYQQLFGPLLEKKLVTPEWIRTHVNIFDTNPENADAMCAAYEAKIAGVGGVDTWVGGLGSDDHIAFNEPRGYRVKNGHRIAVDSGTTPESLSRRVRLTQTTVEDNESFFEFYGRDPQKGRKWVRQDGTKLIFVAPGSAGAREITHEEAVAMVPETAFSIGIKTYKNARHQIVLAAGESKAEAIRRGMTEVPNNNDALSLLQDAPNCDLIIDVLAASRLETTQAGRSEVRAGAAVSETGRRGSQSPVQARRSFLRGFFGAVGLGAFVGNLKAVDPVVSIFVDSDGVKWVEFQSWDMTASLEDSVDLRNWNTVFGYGDLPPGYSGFIRIENGLTRQFFRMRWEQYEELHSMARTYAGTSSETAQPVVTGTRPEKYSMLQPNMMGARLTVDFSKSGPGEYEIQRLTETGEWVNVTSETVSAAGVQVFHIGVEKNASDFQIFRVLPLSRSEVRVGAVVSETGRRGSQSPVQARRSFLRGFFGAVGLGAFVGNLKAVDPVVSIFVDSDGVKWVEFQSWDMTASLEDSVDLRNWNTVFGYGDLPPGYSGFIRIENGLTRQFFRMRWEQYEELHSMARTYAGTSSETAQPVVTGTRPEKYSMLQPNMMGVRLAVDFSKSGPGEYEIYRLTETGEWVKVTSETVIAAGVQVFHIGVEKNVSDFQIFSVLPLSRSEVRNFDAVEAEVLSDGPGYQRVRFFLTKDGQPAGEPRSHLVSSSLRLEDPVEKEAVERFLIGEGQKNFATALWRLQEDMFYNEGLLAWFRTFAAEQFGLSVEFHKDHGLPLSEGPAVEKGTGERDFIVRYNPLGRIDRWKLFRQFTAKSKRGLPEDLLKVVDLTFQSNRISSASYAPGVNSFLLSPRLAAVVFYDDKRAFWAQDEQSMAFYELPVPEGVSAQSIGIYLRSKIPDSRKPKMQLDAAVRDLEERLAGDPFFSGSQALSVPEKTVVKLFQSILKHREPGEAVQIGESGLLFVPHPGPFFMGTHKKVVFREKIAPLDSAVFGRMVEIRLAAKVLDDDGLRKEVMGIFKTLPGLIRDGWRSVFVDYKTSVKVSGGLKLTFELSPNFRKLVVQISRSEVRADGSESENIADIRKVASFYRGTWGPEVVELYLRAEMSLPLAATVIHVKWQDGNWPFGEALFEIAASRVALDCKIFDPERFAPLKTALKTFWMNRSKSLNEAETLDSLSKIPGIDSREVLERAKKLSSEEFMVPTDDWREHVQLAVLRVGRPERLIPYVIAANRQAESATGAQEYSGVEAQAWKPVTTREKVAAVREALKGLEMDPEFSAIAAERKEGTVRLFDFVLFSMGLTTEKTSASIRSDAAALDATREVRLVRGAFERQGLAWTSDNWGFARWLLHLEHANNPGVRMRIGSTPRELAAAHWKGFEEPSAGHRQKFSGESSIPGDYRQSVEWIKWMGLFVDSLTIHDVNGMHNRSSDLRQIAEAGVTKLLQEYSQRLPAILDGEAMTPIEDLLAHKMVAVGFNPFNTGDVGKLLAWVKDYETGETRVREIEGKIKGLTTASQTKKSVMDVPQVDLEEYVKAEVEFREYQGELAFFSVYHQTLLSRSEVRAPEMIPEEAAGRIVGNILDIAMGRIHAGSGDRIIFSGVTSGSYFVRKESGDTRLEPPGSESLNEYFPKGFSLMVTPSRVSPAWLKDLTAIIRAAPLVWSNWPTHQGLAGAATAAGQPAVQEYPAGRERFILVSGRLAVVHDGRSLWVEPLNRVIWDAIIPAGDYNRMLFSYPMVQFSQKLNELFLSRIEKLEWPLKGPLVIMPLDSFLEDLSGKVSSPESVIRSEVRADEISLVADSVRDPQLVLDYVRDADSFEELRRDAPAAAEFLTDAISSVNGSAVPSDWYWENREGLITALEARSEVRQGDQPDDRFAKAAQDLKMTSESSEVILDGGHRRTFFSAFPDDANAGIDQQIASVMENLKRMLGEKNIKKEDVYEVIVSLGQLSEDPVERQRMITKIQMGLRSFLGTPSVMNFIPVMSFIEQSPADGSMLALEVSAAQGKDVDVVRINGKVTAVGDKGMYQIWTGGITPRPGQPNAYRETLDALHQTRDAIKDASRELNRLGKISRFSQVDYRQALRTWFYQNNILKDDPSNGRQRYQQLNEARYDFFTNILVDWVFRIFTRLEFLFPGLTRVLRDQEAKWVDRAVKLGDNKTFRKFIPLSIPFGEGLIEGANRRNPSWPASTGIGMLRGDLVMRSLSFIPRKYLAIWKRVAVWAIRLTSAWQINPFEYTPDVLLSGGTKPPLWSRAMAILVGKVKGLLPEYEIVSISGTASTLGQRVMHVGNARKQAQFMVESVRLMLTQRGGDVSDIPILKVYIKRPQDYAVIKEVIDAKFPGIPIVYTFSDVCRTDWLVEIEAFAYIPSKRGAKPIAAPRTEFIDMVEKRVRNIETRFMENDLDVPALIEALRAGRPVDALVLETLGMSWDELKALSMDKTKKIFLEQRLITTMNKIISRPDLKGRLTAGLTLGEQLDILHRIERERAMRGKDPAAAPGEQEKREFGIRLLGRIYPKAIKKIEITRRVRRIWESAKKSKDLKAAFKKIDETTDTDAYAAAIWTARMVIDAKLADVTGRFSLSGKKGRLADQKSAGLVRQSFDVALHRSRSRFKRAIRSESRGLKWGEVPAGMLKAGQTGEQWFRENKPLMVPIFISGGEGPGVNDYFAYLAEALIKKGLIPVAMKNGIEGFIGPNLHERLAVIDRESIETMKGLGGVEAGMSRTNLLKVPKEDLLSALENMEGFHSYAAIGGGDHAVFWTTFAKKLSGQAEESGISAEELPKFLEKIRAVTARMIVVYKTIDGDVLGQSLGLRSAVENGQALIYSAAASGAAYHEKNILIIPSMGADVGRLPLQAASRYPLNLEFLKRSLDPGDRKLAAQIEKYRDRVLILVPEVKASLQDVSDQIGEIYRTKGSAVLVVAEGFSIREDDPILLRLIDEKSPDYDPEVLALWKKVLKAPRDTHGNIKWGKVEVEKIVAAAVKKIVKPQSLRLDGKLGYGAYRGQNSAYGYFDRLYARLLGYRAAKMIAEGKYGVVLSLPPDDMTIDRVYATVAKRTTLFGLLRLTDRMLMSVVFNVLRWKDALFALPFDAVQEFKERFGLYNALYSADAEQLARQGVIFPKGYQDAAKAIEARGFKGSVFEKRSEARKENPDAVKGSDLVLKVMALMAGMGLGNEGVSVRLIIDSEKTNRKGIWLDYPWGSRSDKLETYFRGRGVAPESLYNVRAEFSGMTGFDIDVFIYEVEPEEKDLKTAEAASAGAVLAHSELRNGISQSANLSSLLRAPQAVIIPGPAQLATLPERRIDQAGVSRLSPRASGSQLTWDKTYTEFLEFFFAATGGMLTLRALSEVRIAPDGISMVERLFGVRLASAAEIAVSQQALTVVSRPEEFNSPVQFAAAKGMFGFKAGSSADAVVLSPKFAFNFGAIAAMRTVFGDMPVAVVVRNDKDIAFMKDLNAKLESANRSKILTARSAAEAMRLIDAEASKRAITVKVKALVSADEASDTLAAEFKGTIKDVRFVTEGELEGFLSQAGSVISKLVAAVQAQFNISRSA